MFTVDVPESAVVRSSLIDPGNSRELVPYTPVRKKDDKSNRSRREYQGDDVEVWVFGNVPPRWITSVQDVTGDPYENATVDAME